MVWKPKLTIVARFGVTLVVGMKKVGLGKVTEPNLTVVSHLGNALVLIGI